MATKLKNLKITKVDFVDEGANPRADIKLTKRKEADTETDADTPEGASQATDSSEVGLLKRFMNWLKGEGLVQKDAHSFDELANAVSYEQISDEIWQVMYALRQSMDSILYDMDLDSLQKAAAMNESLGQFDTAMAGYISTWCSGAVAGIRKSAEPTAQELSAMERDHTNLGDLITKAKEPKGELEDMLKIDKSKMTPEDAAAYEEMKAKYAVEVEETEPVDKAATDTEDPDEDELEEEEAKKKQETKKSAAPQAEEAPESDDIYKGMHPALKAELESLRKMRNDYETRELTDIAKKYTVLGKKPEELVPMLKSMRAADQEAYNQMIALLDAQVDAVNASGLFGEIGKSRSGGGDDVEKMWITKAKKYMETHPDVTMSQAKDAVALEDPELLAKLDQ